MRTYRVTVMFADGGTLEQRGLDEEQAQSMIIPNLAEMMLPDSVVVGVKAETEIEMEVRRV